jgi:SdpI/YfhL protein family
VDVQREGSLATFRPPRSDRLARAGPLGARNFDQRREVHQEHCGKPSALIFSWDQIMAILVTMYVGSGAILIALSIPLILRKVGPNPFYGFRIRQTLEDRQVWFDVNAYSAKGLFVVGAIQVVTALALAGIPGVDIATYAVSCLAVFAIAITVCIVLSVRYLGRISRAKTEPIGG